MPVDPRTFLRECCEQLIFLQALSISCSIPGLILLKQKNGNRMFVHILVSTWKHSMTNEWSSTDVGICGGDSFVQMAEAYPQECCFSTASLYLGQWDLHHCCYQLILHSFYGMQALLLSWQFFLSCTFSPLFWDLVLTLLPNRAVLENCLLVRCIPESLFT